MTCHSKNNYSLSDFTCTMIENSFLGNILGKSDVSTPFFAFWVVLRAVRADVIRHIRLVWARRNLLCYFRPVLLLTWSSPTYLGQLWLRMYSVSTIHLRVCGLIPGSSFLSTYCYVLQHGSEHQIASNSQAIAVHGS